LHQRDGAAATQRGGSLVYRLASSFRLAQEGLRVAFLV
jgi:hypothetical protein